MIHALGLHHPRTEHHTLDSVVENPNKKQVSRHPQRERRGPIRRVDTQEGGGLFTVARSSDLGAAEIRVRTPGVCGWGQHGNGDGMEVMEVCGGCGRMGDGLLRLEDGNVGRGDG